MTIFRVARPARKILKDLETHKYDKAYAKLVEFLETVRKFSEIFSEDSVWVYGNTLETTITALAKPASEVSPQ